MNKLTRNKKILSVLLSIFLVLCLALFLYIKNITIYEPVRIDFSGVSASDIRNIGLYSVSPLNRKTFLNVEEFPDGWDNYYCYHKNIGLIIPDSVAKKITSVNVILGGEQYIIPVMDLVLVKMDNGKHDYILPKNIKSKFSLFKISKLLLHVTVIRYFLIILLCASVILITINKIVIHKTEDFKTKIKRMLPWIKTLIFSIIIALGILYGYLLFKFSIATYITSVLLVFFVMIMLWFMTKIILKIFKVSEKATGKIKKIVIITGIVWFCLETMFRIFSINESYNEKNGLYYASGYKVNTSYLDPDCPGLYSHSRYASYVDKRKEFAYQITSNNEGLRDVDHPVAKPDNEYRIICLGNSYTEGIGAPQDSTWPCFLENKLKKNITNKNISVFNAGISSSDPFFQYNLLEKKLLKYAPDLVLLAPGSSDFEFYKLRGGFERFTPNGIKYREAPKWEKIYAASYVFRFFINNVLQYQNLLPPDKYKEHYINAQRDIYFCFKKFQKLSKKNKFGLIVVFIDDRSTLYFPMISRLKKENAVPVIDLFEYNKTVVGIKADKKSSYYWNIDGHCKPQGYNLFAEGIVWNFKKMGIIDSLNSK